MPVDSRTVSILEVLTERSVGTYDEDLFCSILFDWQNRTIRVVDFKGGRFPAKRKSLEHILKEEGMRKIFTVVERSEVAGWKRIGYRREGSIPGYFNRSDGYIMGCVYDDEYEIDASRDDNSTRFEQFLSKVEKLKEQIYKKKSSLIRLEKIMEEEALLAIGEELKRLKADAKASTKTKKGKTDKNKAKEHTKKRSVCSPLFSQFGREVEWLYFLTGNSRTKKINIVGVEYNECFNNAKINLFFEPATKADSDFAGNCLSASTKQLREMGVGSAFALAKNDDIPLNAAYLSAGFKNTGHLSNQLFCEKGHCDAILWTKKLGTPLN